MVLDSNVIVITSLSFAYLALSKTVTNIVSYLDFPNFKYISISQVLSDINLLILL